MNRLKCTAPQNEQSKANLDGHLHRFTPVQPSTFTCLDNLKLILATERRNEMHSVPMHLYKRSFMNLPININDWLYDNDAFYED